MRKLSPSLHDHLDGGATTLCWLWRLTLADGSQLGFTDHDRALTIDGLIYEAASGLTPGETDKHLGFSMDTGAVQGVLSSQRITPEDIDAGRYDNALLESFRVNWQDTSQIIAISRGHLGTVRRKGGGFEAEWAGEGARLDRSVGRVFSRLCDAEFGDIRCGLNAAGFAAGTTCPRTWDACQNRFTNSLNYRGFPFLLGDDALQAAPQLSERRDGSSRFS